MSAINKLLMSSMLAVLLSVPAVNTALAESTTFHNPEVSTQLKDLKRTASAMRNEADALKSMTMNKRLSWQSHADRLTALKGHVNEMGQWLAELENQQPAATDEQVLAIEQTRLHLVPVAENVTRAIDLLNQRRSNVHWGEYGDAVGDISAHAEALHTKLDAILDYEDARLRFNRLELPPAFTMGE